MHGQVMDASHNKLRSVAQEVTALQRLVVLDLSNNNLTSLPDSRSLAICLR